MTPRPRWSRRTGLVALALVAGGALGVSAPRPALAQGGACAGRRRGQRGGRRLRPRWRDHRGLRRGRPAHRPRRRRRRRFHDRDGGHHSRAAVPDRRPPVARRRGLRRGSTGDVLLGLLGGVGGLVGLRLRRRRLPRPGAGLRGGLVVRRRSRTAHPAWCRPGRPRGRGSPAPDRPSRQGRAGLRGQRPSGSGWRRCSPSPATGPPAADAASPGTIARPNPGTRRDPSYRATVAPGRMVGLGARAGHRRQPHHQPVAADTGDRRRLVGGGGASFGVGMEPGVPLLPVGGAVRGRAPGGVPSGPRGCGVGHGPGHAPRGDHARLDDRLHHRRAGHHGGGRRRVV